MVAPQFDFIAADSDPAPVQPPPEALPLSPPYPEIEPAGSPPEAPQNQPVPGDDESGRPHDLCAGRSEIVGRMDRNRAAPGQFT